MTDIKIPDEAALAIATSAFGEEVRTQIVGEVVKHALTARANPNKYHDKTTVLEKILDTELQAKIRAVAKVWIEEHDLEIRSAVQTTLASLDLEELVTTAVTNKLSSVVEF